MKCGKAISFFMYASPRPSTMGRHCLARDWHSDPATTQDHWVFSPAWKGSEFIALSKAFLNLIQQFNLSKGC